MKHKTMYQTMVNSVILMMVMVFPMKGVFATTHVVQFGGSHGFTYSPSLFSATVGDTVHWEGDFSLHPLSSTLVPAGAATWSQASGSSFVYAVKVAGSYKYQCDVHAGIGMIGSFTVTQSSVKYLAPVPHSGNGSQGIALTTAVASGVLYVKLNMDHAQRVGVSVFDLSGRQVATLVDGILPAGRHMVPFGAKTVARGFYFIKLNSSGSQIVMSVYKGN
jgi:plastocyanin